MWSSDSDTKLFHNRPWKTLNSVVLQDKRIKAQILIDKLKASFQIYRWLMIVEEQVRSSLDKNKSSDVL